MTEAEWLASNDPDEQAKFLGEAASERKLRLFAAACCRRVWDHLNDSRSRAGVEAVEAFADGLIDRAGLRYAYTAASEAKRDAHAAIERRLIEKWRASEGWEYGPEDDGIFRPAADATEAALAVERAAVFGAAAPFRPFACAKAAARFRAHLASPEELDFDGSGLYDANARERASIAEEMSQSALLRDLFGNPFHPVAFSPDWRTDTAVTLARQMYDAHDFSAMPILADALQDAGCGEAAILDHCRGPGPHVRGCWVVDLILGKE